VSVPSKNLDIRLHMLWSFYPSSYVVVFLSLCLCCGLFICLHMLWSFYPSAYVVVFLSICLCCGLFIHLFMLWSFYPSVYVVFFFIRLLMLWSFYLSVCVVFFFIRLLMLWSFYLSVYVVVFLSVCLCCGLFCVQWFEVWGLIKPHLCICLKQEPWYPSSYVVVFFVFNDLRWLIWLLIMVELLTFFFSNILFIEWSRRISRNSNDYLKASCLNYAYWSFRKFKFLNSNLQTASISISWNTELNLQGFLTQVEDSHWNIAKSGIKHHKTNQIFNYGWMSEPISSVKYDNKTPQTKELKAKLAILWDDFNCEVKLFMSYQFLHVTSFRFWTFGEHLLTQSILRQYLCDKVSEISPLFPEIWYSSYVLLLSMSGEKQKCYFEFQILHQTIW
jgi:hypothetical protein